MPAQTLVRYRYPVAHFGGIGGDLLIALFEIPLEHKSNNRFISSEFFPHYPLYHLLLPLLALARIIMAAIDEINGTPSDFCQIAICNCLRFIPRR